MKLPFEEAYCLHLVEAKNRYITSQREFNKVGILDQIKYWWTVKRPFINKCVDQFPYLRSLYYDNYNNSNVYNGVFNCAYEHYNIIKQAYIREIESIIIFEDDIFMYLNEDKFKTIMDNIPADFDIIQFYDTNRWYETQFKEVQLNIKNNDLTKFIKVPNDLIRHSTLCYALSRNGMKEIIDIYDNHEGLIISDLAFNRVDTLKLNYYIPEYIVMSPIDISDISSYILNI